MSRVVFRTAQFENISISSLPLFFSSAGNWQRSTVPATSCFVPTLLHVRNTWNWIKASSLENKLKLILRFKVNLLFLVVYNIASLRSCWRSRYNVHHILIYVVSLLHILMRYFFYQQMRFNGASVPDRLCGGCGEYSWWPPGSLAGPDATRRALQVWAEGPSAAGAALGQGHYPHHRTRSIRRKCFLTGAESWGECYSLIETFELLLLSFF